MEKLFNLSLSVIIFLVDLKDESVISGSFISILKGKAENRPRICFLESAIMGLKWEKREETKKQISSMVKYTKRVRQNNRKQIYRYEVLKQQNNRSNIKMKIK